MADETVGDLINHLIRYVRNAFSKQKAAGNTLPFEYSLVMSNDCKEVSLTMSLKPEGALASVHAAHRIQFEHWADAEKGTRRAIVSLAVSAVMDELLSRYKRVWLAP